ncbi:hypothetical protein BaRGS_00015313 [Batillaria attramentaria]|uniref:Uncharacterized protein n=1 Tax=Batillaria attramentaria TaxID=370345 RepID=A0ABD0L2H0_9CAEN
MQSSTERQTHSTVEGTQPTISTADEFSAQRIIEFLLVNPQTKVETLVPVDTHYNLRPAEAVTARSKARVRYCFRAAPNGPIGGLLARNREEVVQLGGFQ